MIVYGGDYEHTLDVSSIRCGLELNYQIQDNPQLFARVLARQPFDACEFSLSNYIMMIDRGADWLTAVPIFPNRAFRHGAIIVRADSGIDTVKALSGRRFGILDYTMTVAVWCRGIMLEHYGLHWSELTWVFEGTPRFPPPATARVVAADRSLETALAEGAIDAMFLPRSREPNVFSDKRTFRPLLKGWREAEVRYFQSTQIYPISHVVVLHRESIARHPRLGDAVYAAYDTSMSRAKRRRLGASFLPWGGAMWDDVMQVFAGDPMPYGLADSNVQAVDKLQEYLLEQQLITRRYDLEELFEPVRLAEPTEPA